MDVAFDGVVRFKSPVETDCQRCGAYIHCLEMMGFDLYSYTYLCDLCTGMEKWVRELEF